MKMSKAIRMSLNGETITDEELTYWERCPICVVVCERMTKAREDKSDLHGHYRQGEVTSRCYGYCPVVQQVGRNMGLDWYGSGILRETGCSEWGRRAMKDPDSPERIAAEEIILCLEAQGD